MKRRATPEEIALLIRRLLDGGAALVSYGVELTQDGVRLKVDVVVDWKEVETKA